MLDLQIFSDIAASTFDAFCVSMAKKKVSKEHCEQVRDQVRKRNQLQTRMQVLQAQLNQCSHKMGEDRQHLSAEQQRAAFAQMRSLGGDIKELQKAFEAQDSVLQKILLELPNVPHLHVPSGVSALDNVCVRTYEKPKTYDFALKDHLDLMRGKIDPTCAAKVSGARFVYLFGPVATLERALGQWMLDEHIKNGFEEVSAPFLVQGHALVGTGNLPKFEEDLFKTSIAERELYLIPTAEVPLTNIHREQILEDDRPRYYVALTPCFRSEAGSYGKDTKGLIRQHQFSKVEMVKIVRASRSATELETLTASAEQLLQKLHLPYRVMLLCGGDLGFSSAMTYDIEVWLPSQRAFREISSCSNCTDFQARRSQMRWRNPSTGKTELAHTLNGSGLPLGRTLVALLENHQAADGSIWIPPVLHPYVKGKKGFVEQDGQLWMRI